MKKYYIFLALLWVAYETNAQTYDSIPHHGVSSTFFQPQNIAALCDGSILGGGVLTDYYNNTIIQRGFLIHKISRSPMMITDSIIIDSYEHFPWHLFAKSPQGYGNICARIENNNEKGYSSLRVCQFDNELNFDHQNEISVPLQNEMVTGSVPGLVIDPNDNFCISYYDGNHANTHFAIIGLDGTVKQQKTFDSQNFFVNMNLYGPKVFSEHPPRYCSWGAYYDNEAGHIYLQCYVLDSLLNITDSYRQDGLILIEGNHISLNFNWNEQMLGLDDGGVLLASRYESHSPNINDKGAVIIKYDKDFNMTKAIKFLSEPLLDNTHGNRPIGLEKSHDGNVYFSYITNEPFLYDGKYFGRVAVVKMDQDLNIIWQRYCLEPTGYGRERGFMTILDDNSVAIIGNNMNCPEVFYIIVNDDYDGMVEQSDIIRPYLFYPNPAQDQLHLQYSPDVKPKQVELYDLQGRLVRLQSQNLESVDMQGLTAGQYLMKVTLEDGKSFTDKVVKE